MSEGFMGATFTWRNHHGYEYRITEPDEGCFVIQYFEDNDEKPKSEFSFNDIDADGVIGAMQKAVAFYREQKSD